MSVHFAANLVIGSPWSRATSNLPLYFSCTMSQTRAARSACVSGVTTFTGGEDDGEEEEEEEGEEEEEAKERGDKIKLSATSAFVSDSTFNSTEGSGFPVI